MALLSPAASIAKYPHILFQRSGRLIKPPGAVFPVFGRCHSPWKHLYTLWTGDCENCQAERLRAEASIARNTERVPQRRHRMRGHIPVLRALCSGHFPESARRLKLLTVNWRLLRLRRPAGTLVMTIPPAGSDIVQDRLFAATARDEFRHRSEQRRVFGNGIAGRIHQGEIPVPIDIEKAGNAVRAGRVTRQRIERAVTHRRPQEHIDRLPPAGDPGEKPPGGELEPGPAHGIGPHCGSEMPCVTGDSRGRVKNGCPGVFHAGTGCDAGFQGSDWIDSRTDMLLPAIVKEGAPLRFAVQNDPHEPDIEFGALPQHLKFTVRRLREGQGADVAVNAARRPQPEHRCQNAVNPQGIVGDDPVGLIPLFRIEAGKELIQSGGALRCTLRNQLPFAGRQNERQRIEICRPIFPPGCGIVPAGALAIKKPLTSAARGKTLPRRAIQNPANYAVPD